MDFGELFETLIPLLIFALVVGAKVNKKKTEAAAKQTQNTQPLPQQAPPMNRKHASPTEQMMQEAQKRQELQKDNSLPQMRTAPQVQMPAQQNREMVWEAVRETVKETITEPIQQIRGTDIPAAGKTQKQAAPKSAVQKQPVEREQPLKREQSVERERSLKREQPAMHSAAPTVTNVQSAVSVMGAAAAKNTQGSRTGFPIPSAFDANAMQQAVVLREILDRPLSRRGGQRR